MDVNINVSPDGEVGAPRGLRCFWTSQSAARQNCPAKINNHISRQTRLFKYIAHVAYECLIFYFRKRAMEQLNSVAQRSNKLTDNSNCQ